jgi:hypothetical protein
MRKGIINEINLNNLCQIVINELSDRDYRKKT